MASPSDWIILGALFVLAAICASCFTAGPRGAGGKPKDRRRGVSDTGSPTGE